MENLSCHSNESTQATAMKNNNLTNISAKFQLHSHYVFWGDDFVLEIWPFCCHGNQSNIEVWTKIICLAEDYSRNISVKLLSKYLQWDSHNGQFSLFHTIRLMLWTFQHSFSFTPLMASEEMISENLFANLAFLLPWQPIKFSGLEQIHIFGRGLLKEHFCKDFVKISAVR